MHARIALALLAPDQAMPHLGEASRIALAAGMQDDVRLVDRLMQGRPATVPHPLVFA